MAYVKHEREGRSRLSGLRGEYVVACPTQPPYSRTLNTTHVTAPIDRSATYDTSVARKANTGHVYGADLCPDTTGLDPVADRKEIETRLMGARVGALLAYLKTL